MLGDGAPIIGIDLGTTNSVVAIAKDGEVRVIPDENGSRIQSSMVAFFDDGSVVVGNEARREAVIDPVNTVYSAKRLIGRDFNAEATRQALQHLPYTVVGGDSGAPMIEIYGELFGLPEISGMVLRRMKDIAERSLGESLTKAVITVPANFNDTQRQMTKLAGTLAGLEVVRVLNEPTAAALAYGYGKGIDARIAIYDFGGGTFDITILDITGSIFEVISTAGDTFLGGDDLDYRMVNYMLRIFQREHNMSIEDDQTAVSRLKQVAEKLKIELSEKERAVVTIHELTVDRKKKPLGLKFQVNREAFSLRCEDIIQRTFLVCDEALRGAGLKAAEIDAVVLVGGSTRMPVVREMVAAYFGRAPLTDINPEEVVAVGAAIQANSLHSNPFEPGAKPQPLLLDVTPMSLGLQTVAGFYDILIQRNTCIPCEQKRVFTTTTDGQTSVRVQIFQGESRSAAENIKLGEVELYGLRAAPRGEVQIEVIFEIDTDGIVLVTARDQETGMEQATRVSVHAGYSDDDLSAMMNRGD